LPYRKTEWWAHYTTLMSPYSYPMGHHSHSFVSQNGSKRLKTGFDDTYLHNLSIYTQVCSMGQQEVFNYSTNYYDDDPI
jgi:hypothetical protein